MGSGKAGHGKQKNRWAGRNNRVAFIGNPEGLSEERQKNHRTLFPWCDGNVRRSGRVSHATHVAQQRCRMQHFSGCLAQRSFRIKATCCNFFTFLGTHSPACKSADTIVFPWQPPFFNPSPGFPHGVCHGFRPRSVAGVVNAVGYNAWHRMCLSKSWNTWRSPALG